MDPAPPTEEIRQCTLCRELKPLPEFHRRGLGRQTWCKACRRPYDAAYYQRRRDVRMLQKRERKRRLKAWMRDFKASLACADCGGRFHWAAMTFDHLPGKEKRGEVSNLLMAGYYGVLIAEMAKCEPVCANCHAVRTFLRRSSCGPNSLQESAVS